MNPPAALTAAKNGDTIAITAGTYVDQSLSINKDVTLKAVGGPVIFTETKNIANGKAYLVVGEHKPMNDQLAEFCGKTVTLKGKAADRGGIAMLENAEIVKK